MDNGFYLLSDLTIDYEWYLQSEPTESPFDHFYIQSDPDENDFYLKDYLEVDNDNFYLLELFDFGETAAFYLSDIDEEDSSGFIVQSEFDGGRHDWRDELNFSADPLSTVEHLELPIEELNFPVEEMQLTPFYIQTDATEWTFLGEDD